MVSVLLRADVIDILALRVAPVPADGSVMCHIAVAFSRSVSEIGKSVFFKGKLKLKSETGQPNDIFADFSAKRNGYAAVFIKFIRKLKPEKRFSRYSG